MVVRFHIPIRLVSLPNARKHWRVLSDLVRYQREMTTVAMSEVPMPRGPWIVTLTRVGPRMLDDDNLAAACKHVRDQIAQRLAGGEVGQRDGPEWFTWHYAQERGTYGVDVEIETRPT